MLPDPPQDALTQLVGFLDERGHARTAHITDVGIEQARKLLDSINERGAHEGHADAVCEERGKVTAARDVCSPRQAAHDGECRFHDVLL